MLTGGGSPGPSRVLALLLLLTVVLSAAAPRVLEAVQSRVLRESLAALGLPAARPGPWSCSSPCRC